MTTTNTTLDTSELIAASVTVVTHERRSDTVEATYYDLVTHFNLTRETKAGDLTTTSRVITLLAISGIKKYEHIVMDHLASEKMAASVAYGTEMWKAARAVRAGLVRNLPGESESPEADYMKLAREASERARDNGGFTAEAIIEAITAALSA